jgi:ABC-type uncharacterized transport system permease subunit
MRLRTSYLKPISAAWPAVGLLPVMLDTGYWMLDRERELAFIDYPVSRAALIQYQAA